jgi:hypothetical protein
MRPGFSTTARNWEDTRRQPRFFGRGENATTVACPFQQEN